VLDGRGTLHVEGEDVPLETGDAVLVPVNVDHGLSASRDVALRIAIVFALI
jgi:quercetin dioxygenase-like cupin family protein